MNLINSKFSFFTISLCFVFALLSGITIAADNTTTTTTTPTTSTTPAPDRCNDYFDCKSCVQNNTATNVTCGFEITGESAVCQNKISPVETIRAWITDIAHCPAAPNTTTTTTTTTEPTTTTTTQAPTTTNGSTTTTTAPTTTQMTTTKVTTTMSPNATSTAAPHHDDHGGFSFGSFCGGVVTAIALSAAGYVGFRFYRARRDQNLHSLL